MGIRLLKSFRVSSIFFTSLFPGYIKFKAVDTGYLYFFTGFRLPLVKHSFPDFTLMDISGTESITLSDYRGKRPVAMVFGSFT